MALPSFDALVRRGFLGLLIVSMSVVILVYGISPRRDAAFVATSSNAGSGVAWFATISEATWVTGSRVLAGALAINVVLLLLTMPLVQRIVTQHGPLARLATVIGGIVLGHALAYVLWFGLLWYLLTQSIVD